MTIDGYSKKWHMIAKGEEASDVLPFATNP